MIFAIVLLGSLIYLGYRVVESRKDTASLTKQAMENDVPTVAIVHAEPLPAKETIQLPGTIEAWFQAPIYAPVSGYVQRGDVLAAINAPAQARNRPNPRSGGSNLYLVNPIAPMEGRIPKIPMNFFSGL